MINLQSKIPTDSWVKANWEEYIQIVENDMRNRVS
jgi:hypothetical protein